MQVDIFSIIFRRGKTELRITQFAAFPAEPAAMIPWPHDQYVECIGVLLFNRFIGMQRSEEILPVVPSADHHDRCFDILQMREDIAPLPEPVVIRMACNLVPKFGFPFEIVIVYVFQRSHIHEELVSIRRFDLTDRVRPFINQSFASLRHTVEKSEPVRQHKGPVMVDVIPIEIGHRCLGRNGFESRMGIDSTGGRVEAGVRDAPLTDFAVVVRDVFDEPFDCVVGVRAFVYVGVASLVCNVRGHVDELAFRHKPAAHVLIDKNETFLLEFFVRADITSVFIGSVRTDAIGRAQ